MPIPEDFYEATMVWQCDGNLRQFTWGIGLYDPLSPGSRAPAAVAQDVYEAATADGSVADPQYVSALYQFLGVSVALGTPTGPLVGDYFDNIRGTGSGNPCPANCAILVTKQTASGGRRNKGRLYHPPVFPSESLIDQNGVIAALDLPALQGVFDVFLNELTSADLVPMLFHQSGDQTPTAITGFAVSGLIATQRRRMRG